MTFKTGTGSTIAIGTTLATTGGTQAEYEADVYVNIADIESIGPMGDERANVGFAALADGRRQKARGIADAGDSGRIDLQVGGAQRSAGAAECLGRLSRSGRGCRTGPVRRAFDAENSGAPA